MKNWFEKITAQLNALFAPRMQPIPIRSDEQRRLAATSNVVWPKSAVGAADTRHSHWERRPGRSPWIGHAYMRLAQVLFCSN